MAIITLDDPRYPSSLKQIHDPPQQLYVRGNIDALNQKHLLAVVGSRKASSYGKQAIDKLLPPVVDVGITIVSGLAFGIDALAHRAAVDAGAPTIAVLASGVDDITPRSNVTLGHRILEHGGAIVSEYPPGTPPTKERFPARNRIIAGLSRATLIVQAAFKSGSLITAKLALGYNRDVCAVPGLITDPLAAGTNDLIQNGARPILTAQDLLDFFAIAPDKQPSLLAAKLTPTQKALLKHITATPQHVDDIAAHSEQPASIIAITLTELELAGQIQHVGGMKYVKQA